MDYLSLGYNRQLSWDASNVDDPLETPNLLGAESNDALLNEITDVTTPESLIGGTYTKELVIGKNAHIRGGADGYDDGSGFFLGYRQSNSDFAFFIGSSTGNKLTYNTTDDTLAVTGSITASAGAIGGFEIGSDYIRDAANSMGLASTVTAGDDVRFWAGDTFANRATAPFRTTESGLVYATNFIKISRTCDFIGYDQDGLSTAVDGGGSVNRTITLGSSQLGTGSTTGNAATMYSGIVINGLDFDNNHEFETQIEYSHAVNQDSFFGVGLATEAAVPEVPDNATSVKRHIGFFVEDGTLYASMADGTTQEKTAITGITLIDVNSYSLVFTATSGADFYVNGDYKTTLNTYPPSGNTDYGVNFSIETQENVTHTMSVVNRYQVRITP